MLPPPHPHPHPTTTTARPPTHTHPCAEPLPMLKLKDFPPRNDFRRVMRRHYDDFVGLLNQ